MDLSGSLCACDLRSSSARRSETISIWKQQPNQATPGSVASRAFSQLDLLLCCLLIVGSYFMHSHWSSISRIAAASAANLLVSNGYQNADDRSELITTTCCCKPVFRRESTPISRIFLSACVFTVRGILLLVSTRAVPCEPLGH